MSKIYTRRGDDGSTGLFGGPRVRKDDLRVGAYGEVDELNSALGAAREELLEPAQKDLLAIVDALQSELFTLGSELATPQADKAPREVPRIRAEMVARMEKDIDRLAAERSEEHTSELQSRLHLVCRLLLEKKKTASRNNACKTAQDTHET